MVNRPLSLISRVVSANEDIPQQGLLFDPLIVNDFLQNDDAARQEVKQADEGPVDCDGSEDHGHDDRVQGGERGPQQLQQREVCGVTSASSDPSVDTSMVKAQGGPHIDMSIDGEKNQD